MDFESSAIDQLIDVIVNYTGYSTVWNKTVFEVQDFDSDIPSGNMHNGICPFVAIRGGLSDDYTQVSGDLYEGTTELEIYIAISAPLIFSRESWAPIHTFTGEIERAIATLDGDGFRMSPHTSKSNPVSLNQMVNRVLTISIEGSECRETPVAPEFQTSPVISGTPQPGEALTAVHGTATGTPEPVITGEWYLEGVATGDTDLTYIVPNNVGDNVTFLDTATNDMDVDTALSNQLEIESGFEVYPLTVDAFYCLKSANETTVNCNDIRVGVAGGTVSYDDDRDYDTAEHDAIVLAGGGGTAYATGGYDNEESWPTEQVVEARQPIIDNVGELSSSDGSRCLVAGQSATPVFPSATTQVSASVIVNFSSMVGSQTIIGKFGGGVASLNWGIVLSGTQLRLLLSQSGGAVSSYFDVSGIISIGTDYLIRVIYDSVDGPRFWVDGDEKTAINPQSGSIDDGLGGLGIMGNSGGAPFGLKGTMRLATVYNGKHTPADVVSEYNWAVSKGLLT